MNGLTAAIIVICGLIAGSFLNVCVYRLPRGLSIIRPGSRCPECGHKLASWENLPLLSFLLLRGRCRECGKAIGWRYPVLEGATAGLFLLSWLRAGAGWEFVRDAFFLSCLLTLAVTDLEWRLLPDALTLSGWAVGLGFAAWVVAAGGPGLVSALAASFGGAGCLALVAIGYQRLRGREGLGWGDVKMAGFLGSFLGIHGLLAALFLASIGGAVVGLGQAAVVLAGRRRRGRSWRRARESATVFLSVGALPFGVFLAAAGGWALLAGPALWRSWLG